MTAAAPCPVCGAPVTRHRYCSRRCMLACRKRSRRRAPLWINRLDADTPPIAHPSVRQAVAGSDLRPTPAELRAALARIGREMAR